MFVESPPPPPSAHLGPSDSHSSWISFRGAGHLSPITAYSTLSTPDGRKKTYYYAPQEKEWGESLIANLGRKAKALGWAADIDRDLEESWVRPYKVRMTDQKILDFKGTIIKGWTGLYEVNLPEPYFRLAYDAGFGAKNAQGFGMVGVIR
ncbi:MAG: CRISPR-associated endoribonuclease Cas6 [Rubrobacteraceae bacterium]